MYPLTLFVKLCITQLYRLYNNLNFQQLFFSPIVESAILNKMWYQAIRHIGKTELFCVDLYIIEIRQGISTKNTYTF